MLKYGIRHQILMLVLAPTVVISVLLAGYFTWTRINDLEESFQLEGETIALKLASSSEYGIFTRNKVMLQNLANSAINENNSKNIPINGIAFYTETGEEITNFGKITQKFVLPKTGRHPHSVVENSDTVLSLTVPIYTNREIEDQSEPGQKPSIMGSIKIELDNTSVHVRQYEILKIIGSILLLGLGLSGLLAFHLGSKVTTPILELAEAIKRIREGDLSTRIQTTSYYELEVLESGINIMTETLENAQIELQNKIDRATSSLRRSLETIEIQNLELDIARRTAEKTSQVKSEFLADMSHEIRTPLNGVIGFVNLLDKTLLNSTQKEYLTTIKKSAQTLLGIINDILDFSKIEAGKLRIEHTLMNVSTLVVETLKFFAPFANEKALGLFANVDPEVPLEVLSDPLRFQQIITNLIANAIKFTDTGSVKVEVKVEEKREESLLLRVNIIDTGPGLSKEEQQGLFQAFTQVNTHAKFGGTGLGLAICKKLVSQLQGNIGLDSIQGQGSTIWFTCVVGIIANENAVSKSLPEALPLPIQKLCYPRPIRILAVDDHPENLKLITVLLKEMGVIVTGASSGEEALSIVQAFNPFHIIFMDIRMPTINGIEATRLIRSFEKEKQLKCTPIIALTAHALVTEREALFEAGMNDYLIKPIDEQALERLIHHWVNAVELKIPPPVDWALATKLAGGSRPLAKELFEKLIISLPQDNTKILDAAETQNWDLCRDVVHHLHGACAYCGVPELKNSLQNLEKSLTEHPRKLEDIPLKLKRVQQAIEEILQSQLDKMTEPT